MNLSEEMVQLLTSHDGPQKGSVKNPHYFNQFTSFIGDCKLSSPEEAGALMLLSINQMYLIKPFFHQQQQQSLYTYPA
jgi:hypothetical protein